MSQGGLSEQVHQAARNLVLARLRFMPMGDPERYARENALPYLRARLDLFKLDPTVADQIEYGCQYHED
ncbi:MAG: hypothetical protein J5J00_08625 [Deltaproteobacteria bacterium]|nr:hypothetical protein [Deltaproteobacteria bacterium]